MDAKLAAREKMRSPRNVLFACLKSAIEGDPDYQEPPTAWIERQERRAKESKRREREESKLSGRPAPPRVPQPPAAALQTAPELQDLWSGVLAQVEKNYGRPTVDMWFRDAAVSRDGDRWSIRVPNGATRDHVQRRYARALREILEHLGETVSEFRVEVLSG